MMIEAVKNSLPLRAYLLEHGVLFRGKITRCISRDHEDKTPSASLYIGRDKFERLRCFGCGFDVDLIGAAMELNGLDFKGTLKLLADKTGLSTRQTSEERQAAEKARKERERKAELVRAFRQCEQEMVSMISAVLRSYRHMRATRTSYAEAELVALAEVQGEIEALENYYEILCGRDYEAKIELREEMTGYAGREPY